MITDVACPYDMHKEESFAARIEQYEALRAAIMLGL